MNSQRSIDVQRKIGWYLGPARGTAPTYRRALQFVLFESGWKEPKSLCGASLPLELEPLENIKRGIYKVTVFLKADNVNFKTIQETFLVKWEWRYEPFLNEASHES